MDYGPKNIPEFVRRGEWWIEKKHLEQMIEVRSTDPPREFSLLQQLVTDLSSARSAIMYLLIFGLLGYGAVTRSWVELALGSAGLFILVRSFHEVVTTHRHGAIARVRLDSVQHELAGGQGVSEQVAVEGRKMNVGYALGVVRAILETGCEVEMEVLFNPRSKKPVASAVAYRAQPRSYQPRGS